MVLTTLPFSLIYFLSAVQREAGQVEYFSLFLLLRENNCDTQTTIAVLREGDRVHWVKALVPTSSTNGVGTL